MYLSDKDIKRALEEGHIVIEPFDETRLQPASYDLLLGNKFMIYDQQSVMAIDPANKIYPRTREIIIPDGEHFVLHPGISILGTSVDYFGSNKYLVQLSGKSSLARVGLIVHNTAGLINPGHFLNITFELSNLNTIPIILRPKMRIGQIIFSELSGAPNKDYKTTGRYQGRDWQHFVEPKEEEMKTFKRDRETAKNMKSKVVTRAKKTR